MSGLREAFFMFWETFWALVLGFSLSGVVQSFVSRERMERSMGDHAPRTIVRTSLLGMASSSCSYAASALAKTLFQRGADLTTSMVFMFASTNLVLELGIVLWLLLGWQFALAELVGGIIMITLLVLVAPRVLPEAEVAEARRNLEAVEVSDKLSRTRLQAWRDAAGYAVSDLRMLRRELVIGYVVAGVIAVEIPTKVFTAVFLPGHGFLTDLENAIVGPVIACVSFVCSIGNVPLAAALYDGGSTFGGTVAFVFADLLALPLLLIYAKLYGRRLAVRLGLVFWAVMSTAGLLTDLLFRGVGIPFPHRRGVIAKTHFAWDRTTFLNLAFLVVAVVVWQLSRVRSDGYAIDPICGMQVDKANPGARSGDVYFCCDGCRDTYAKRLTVSSKT